MHEAHNYCLDASREATGKDLYIIKKSIRKVTVVIRSSLGRDARQVTCYSFFLNKKTKLLKGMIINISAKIVHLML